jgi:hypothetical protein
MRAVVEALLFGARVAESGDSLPALPEFGQKEGVEHVCLRRPDSAMD